MVEREKEREKERERERKRKKEKERKMNFFEGRTTVRMLYFEMSSKHVR
jgi:hypothetical protein